FKAVNDSLGHGEGDRLLVGVSERMVECIRAADTGARLGGDEFAVLIEDAPDIGTIVAIAERIVAALQLPFVLQGKPVAVGASIGIAQATSDGGAGELLRNADVAMYTAKSRGKGRYEIFQPEMHTAVLARLELEADLRHAVERGEFVLHFQPIVELDTGRLSGLEALCRWLHPEKGLVSPATFIPLAEEMGLIVPLGRWALLAACTEAREWQTRHPGAHGVSVSVNISGRQLDNASLVEDVATALRDSGLGAESLVLEITESVIMHNTDDTLHRLKDLKSLGVRLAIDDFGTGFSSLSYLQRFPVDILKIDKSFIDGFGAGGKDSALVRTIIALSDTMKLRTVAEGVETAAQADELRSLGCALAQGYHFARPMAPADVDDYLTREEALVG
ncbi:MAG: bifunctional diguanylate cyclase/phosphodiesterase, partial [Gemmatimonadota bacterium]|nr:bifunctional diguanylate cyclase/phosphodiesterase [Gemmatimonadota bacterium]